LCDRQARESPCKRRRRGKYPLRNKCLAVFCLSGGRKAQRHVHMHIHTHATLAGDPNNKTTKLVELVRIKEGLHPRTITKERTVIYIFLNLVLCNVHSKKIK